MYFGTIIVCKVIALIALRTIGTLIALTIYIKETYFYTLIILIIESTNTR